MTARKKSQPKKSSNTAVSKDAWRLFYYMAGHIGDEVIVVDKQARIVFVNKAAVKSLGLPVREILKRRFIDFFQEKMSVKQWQKDYFAKLKRKRKPLTYTINRIARGKKVRIIDMTVSFMPYNNREYLLAVGRDITDQRTFQMKLKESEDRYKVLCEQAADGIMMFDAQGAVMYANNAAGAMLKSEPSRLVGQHFEKLVSENSLKWAWKNFRHVKSGLPIRHMEFKLRDKMGGRLPVEFSASPILRNGKVIQIHVIFRDISQRKELDHLIRETEKMEALQHFIAGTTHEIQQPLKGLLDHSQNLIDRYRDMHFEYIGYKEFKDIMRTLKTMNDQVRYCFDTTDRLYSIQRKKVKLKDGYCNANAVIRETVQKIKHSIEVSKIKLRVKLDPRLPAVAISALDLGQIVNNILTNAVQSLPGESGNILIKTAYLISDHRVRIECQDDGVGISKDVINKVYDPFFTTKPRGLEKSSGLGLYIVYSIIKAHKGDIKIKSQFRKGTLVAITLPVHRPKAKSAPNRS